MPATALVPDYRYGYRRFFRALPSGFRRRLSGLLLLLRGRCRRLASGPGRLLILRCSRLARGLWYSWGMGEVDTSAMSAW